MFAYLLYDLVSLSIRFLYSRAVYIDTVRLAEEPLVSAGLDRLLLPHGSSLFGPMLFGAGSKLDGAARILTSALRWGSFVSPFIIELYALYRLFRVFGDGDVLVWLSAFFSVAFMLYAVVIVVVNRPMKLRRRRYPDQEVIS